MHVFKFNLYRTLRRVHGLNLRTVLLYVLIMHEWIAPPLFPVAPLCTDYELQLQLQFIATFG